jgi:serine protease Do
MDTYLKLLGPDGYVIAEDDDGGGDTNSKIYISSLPSSGTYTIVAGGYDGGTGSYQLTLE